MGARLLIGGLHVSFQLQMPVARSQDLEPQHSAGSMHFPSKGWVPSLMMQHVQATGIITFINWRH